VIISADSAPALGDVRAARATVWIRHGAEARRDWPRYLDALMAAIAHGADVRWLR
jgi:hypothetical protein